MVTIYAYASILEVDSIGADNSDNWKYLYQ